MKILGIVPARFASTRFPGKPLAMIGNKSMIHRVCEQASKAKSLDHLVVATDDSRIYDHVLSAGYQAVLTNPNHPTGTDRCQEVCEILGSSFDYAINIQGDEPFIQPEQIDILAQCLNGETQLATLVKQIEEFDTLWNQNGVRVVFNQAMEALYFSRATIPYLRGIPKEEWLEHYDFYKHIGIYAYRTDILKQITKLPQGKLEKAESLEQLRWLEHGFKIKVNITTIETQGIDTPEDLQRAVASGLAES